MKFDDLDAKMRVFETAHDHCVLPGIYIVVRLDGRGFTRLTKDVHEFEAPFDERFRDLMTHTTTTLMESGFRTVYGHTQSDEISILLHRDEDSFGRKERKLNSLLAGEASAAFSMKLGAVGVFDSRVCQLPNAELVRDYFRWRHEDANRNALSAHCYWIQRREGASAKDATHRLRGMSVSVKNEFLFQRGVNFNDLPAWQKRGTGVHWVTVQKQAVDRKTGEPVTADRRALRVDSELPKGEAYGTYVLNRISESETTAKTLKP
jgi:tRNA(His) 5'-end guanylyltransferase